MRMEDLVLHRLSSLNEHMRLREGGLLYTQYFFCIVLYFLWKFGLVETEAKTTMTIYIDRGDPYQRRLFDADCFDHRQ
jgi:hypothetical protein